MPAIIVSEDLRSIKTEKALYAAMFSLLKRNHFRKITIKGICEEALVSRAAFYAHYIDKYDLLKHWIVELWPKAIAHGSAYSHLERYVNCHIDENLPVIRNLFYDADSETYDILFNFLLSTINLTIDRTEGSAYQKSIVLSNFYAGGILSYMFWQVKNKFPADVPTMNKYFYDIVHELQDWRAK